MNEVQLLYSALAGALILMKIPYVGKVLRVLNTLVHETGHALMAILTSGKVVKVELFANLSGTTHTLNSGKLALIAVGLSGYLFASAMAWCSACLIELQFHRWLLVLLMVFAVVNLVLYVRNGYGMLWLTLFITGSGVLLSKGNIEMQRIVAIVMMAVLMVDSVLSSVELLLISFREPKKAGDAALLGKATGLPAQLFALFFVGIALVATYDAVARFFPSPELLFP